MSENKLPEVGDFLYSSWGYDQTNVQFYKVVKVSKASVWLQEWQNKVSNVVGWASEYVVPGDAAKSYVNHQYGEDGFHSLGCEECAEVFAPVEVKRWSKYGGVSFSSYKGAWLWDGQPKYASHYA